MLGACQSTSAEKSIKQTLFITLEPNKLLQHLKKLSSDTFQGRKTSTKHNIQAQQYIIEQLTQYSVQPFKGKFTHPFKYSSSFGEKKGSNVVAFIEGSNKSSDYILLSAHFDHLGKKGNKIYNGADDNASGVSALLSISELLVNQPIKHNVILLFTDAEEQGLKGSKAFVDDNLTLLTRIKLNINIDMLAGSKTSKKLHYVYRGLNELFPQHTVDKFNNNHLYEQLPIVKGFTRNRHTLNKRINWLHASDHGSFHKKGVPFIYYGVGTHQNYHSENDVFSKTNHQLFINSSNAIFQQLLFIDQII